MDVAAHQGSVTGMQLLVPRSRHRHRNVASSLECIFFEKPSSRGGTLSTVEQLSMWKDD